jgi:hypothetical protein
VERPRAGEAMASAADRAGSAAGRVAVRVAVTGANAVAVVAVHRGRARAAPHALGPAGRRVVVAAVLHAGPVGRRVGRVGRLAVVRKAGGAGQAVARPIAVAPTGVASAVDAAAKWKRWRQRLPFWPPSLSSA